jgi:hypothetical protein
MYKKKWEQLTFREHLVSPPVLIHPWFGGVRIIHFFFIYFIWVVFWEGGVLCLVPNAASVSGLSIRYC